jgi:hypothetical protein
MSLFPNEPPPPHAKPKLTAEQLRTQEIDQLMAIRLRVMVGTELDERGITTPAAIGAALDMPPGEAMKLLTRHQWYEGEAALLQAVATRLGLLLPDSPIDWPTGHSHYSR